MSPCPIGHCGYWQTRFLLSVGQALIAIILVIVYISFMRLKAEIWIGALLRRAQSAGAMALVAHRGDKDAGTVMVRVNRLDGCSALFVPFTGLDGDRRWRVLADLNTCDSKVEEIISREIQYDPDLWVVEIEDRQGRHFLDEVIDILE